MNSVTLKCLPSSLLSEGHLTPEYKISVPQDRRPQRRSPCLHVIREMNLRSKSCFTKIGKRPVIGQFALNGSGYWLKQTFVGEE